MVGFFKPDEACSEKSKAGAENASKPMPYSRAYIPRKTLMYRFSCAKPANPPKHCSITGGSEPVFFQPLHGPGMIIKPDGSVSIVGSQPK